MPGNEFEEQLMWLAQADRDLAEAEARVAQLKERREHIQEQITDILLGSGLMQSLPGAGVEYTNQFHVPRPDGPGVLMDFKVETKLHTGISRENKEDAHAWLLENGHGDLIKTVVKIPFGRGYLTKANAVAEKYDGAYVETQVHGSTLRAWARKRLLVGQYVPPNLFSAFYQQYVTLEEHTPDAA